MKFFTQSGLSKRTLLTLFVLKIFVLIIGCYLNVFYLLVSDSVTFHNMGVEEFHILFQNPHEYFTNIYHSYSAEQYSRLLDTSRSFWNDLRSNLIAKMLSLFDIFSFKSFLINTLFFNFLVFFGLVALYRVFIKIFPGSFIQLILCIFVLPSALFFSSMIHRDGLILLSIGMAIYHSYFMMEDQQYTPRKIGLVVFFLLVIFLLRNFVFITLIPALGAWLLARKFPRHAFLSFVGVYVLVTILFFTSGYISPRTSLPQYVSSRQLSFIEVGKLGNSTIPINTLDPNFKSFLNNLPQAFNHSLMRPYLSEIVSVEYAPFALEIFIIQVLFFIFLFYHKKKIIINPLIYFGVFFSMTMLLVTGYTVPIIGAIVRYRSIYLIFLLIPILCYTDWQKIRTILNINKNII
ncbi:MAG: hypothetical protein ABI237_07900 [Ginsengibacter sp.]